MLNLLSSEQKKLLEREYYLRLMSIALVLLLAALFVAALFLVPTLILSRVRLDIAEGRLEEARKTEHLATAKAVGYEELEATVTKANAQIGILRPTYTLLYADELVRTVLGHKPSGIKITGFHLTGSEPREFFVTGSSATRSMLLSFVQSLKREKIFTDVELPVSNFTKDSNIDFSIRIQGIF
ncbi:MAG: hypothetical protein Q7S15_01285 [bacterium]|nr:hypothetical protein [bacterium]